MKGVVAQCLSEVVIAKHGGDKWKEILARAGVDRNITILATSDMDDATVMKIMQATCEVLKTSRQQVADAFGEYWVNTFAPRIYSAYYKGAKTARDFLLKMDDVHDMATRNTPNARPPRFTYQWLDNKTLIMGYSSHRNLVDLLVGLIRGVGIYFKENLVVTKESETKVKIVFP